MDIGLFMVVYDECMVLGDFCRVFKGFRILFSYGVYNVFF